MNITTVDPAHLCLQQVYDETAKKYRQQDEEHVSGDDYKHLSRALENASASFGHEIDVLDLGCGTGRYFHCVRNVRRLVGLDISQEMLDAAKTPVKADQVSAREVVLMKSDLFSENLPPASFDFVYCLGVFGNGCQLSKEACGKVYNWLKPGGMWLFDAMDVSELPLVFRIRKTLAAVVYASLPFRLKALWLKRCGWPPFYGTHSNQARTTLLSSGFAIEWITSRRSRLPGGHGFKLEVLCRKPK